MSGVRRGRLQEDSCIFVRELHPSNTKPRPRAGVLFDRRKSGHRSGLRVEQPRPRRVAVLIRCPEACPNATMSVRIAAGSSKLGPQKKTLCFSRCKMSPMAQTSDKSGERYPLWRGRRKSAVCNQPTRLIRSGHLRRRSLQTTQECRQCVISFNGRFLLDPMTNARKNCSAAEIRTCNSRICKEVRARNERAD